MKFKRNAILAVGAVFAVTVAACGSSKTAVPETTATTAASTTAAPTTAASTTAAPTTTAGPTTTAHSLADPWGWPGDAKTGYTAPNEPDVNGDGKVVIGVISPGDLNDHGYYESFVDTANAFAKDNGWTIIPVGKVAAADAAKAARDMCAQHPDMVAIAASELKDAIPVSQEDVCKGTVWYVAGGQGVDQTKFFVQTNDIESQSAYASGVAAGLLLKAAGKTKAGFITGGKFSFTTDFEKGWTAGIKSVVPTGTVVATYTGDFNDSAKAVEAYKAMKAQGIAIVYPYLGGATFAVAGAAKNDKIPVLTPGTDNCAIPDPPFAISVIFSPGDYFGAALGPFKSGKLKVGVALTFHMGSDPVPTVKICKPTGDQATVLAQLITDIGTGKVRTDQLTGLDDYHGYVPGS